MSPSRSGRRARGTPLIPEPTDLRLGVLFGAAQPKGKLMSLAEVVAQHKEFNDRTAAGHDVALALACVTLDRGKTAAEQCAAIRSALPALVGAGLARRDSRWRWYLTDEGKRIADGFLRECRTLMRRIAERQGAVST